MKRTGPATQPPAGAGAADIATLESLAAELLPDVPQLADEFTAHLVASIPEFQADEDAFWQETRSSTEANFDQVMRLVRLGVSPDALVVPVETAEWVRGLVRRGIGLPALLRASRLGHSWLWARWSHTLGARIPDPDALTAANEQLSAFLFAYVDRISDVLVDAYGTERERAARGAKQLRTETIRAILTGEPIDEEIATRRLGYDLRRHHLALRITSTGNTSNWLERAATEAAHAAGLSEPLIATTGHACVDVWVGCFDTPTPEVLARLEAYQPPEGIAVAVGTTGKGLDGFRASHEQARHAARIAALSGPRARGVTTYWRIELVSLLAGDLPRARTFVAGRLGPLAATDAATERLRDTVLLFLNAGGSASRTGRELVVHSNTVTYRVKRAEELLGRRVTDEPVELTCALTLVAVLGTTVLTEDSG